ncbi:hypothetical protein [Streptomyces griseoluteus]|uniref:hypothetical protein n=1 Tax=Streptomyces griseoluteus TaxID=29306 RepID=UPI0019B36328|nr:hypothetical protein [Streptomyces griseoluteus]GHF12806.1 hypothetical protein GCM10017776_33290 [Streptomyces griseoluteus]
MNEASTLRLTRRQALLLGTGLTAGVVLSGTGTATAAAPAAAAGRWNRSTSANGWPVVEQATRHRVEGAEKAEVPLLDGDVATVLLYVARRFSYEIDTLRVGDLQGHTTDRSVGAPFESNHLSGTALAIRPLFYPLGAQPGTGLTEREKTIVQDILADCEGVVAWGGELTPVKESHFHIGVRPGDPRLERLARRIIGWDATPGQGAGAIDAFDPARVRRARKARSER